MINPDLPVPLYEQLADLLREQVKSGELTGRVPSVRTLAQEHGVSTRTAERALHVLQDEGVLVVLVGKGFYVARLQALLAVLQPGVVAGRGHLAELARG
jgi:GntR family transcriptional regulator